MLTPQEVKSRAFQRVSFGGYNMGQVDEFLDILTEDYTALYNDNAVLKSKMKVLVDKVEEYRATEEAMRKALMTAQRMADELVREAEEKKAAILAEAEEKAAVYVTELTAKAQAEELRLATAKNNTAAFVEQLRGLYAEQVQFLAKLEELAPVTEVAAPAADPMVDTVSEIDDSVQRLLAKAVAEATAENVKAKAEEDGVEMVDLEDTAEFEPIKADQEPTVRLERAPVQDEYAGKTTRINFGDLQFGKDYEIM